MMVSDRRKSTMLKRLLALCLTLMLVAGAVALPVQEAQAASTTATIKGGWLRLRSGPSYKHSTITSYYTGTVVTVLGSSGVWFQVTTPDGRTGYMHGDYLTINGSGGTPTAPGGAYENIAATVVSRNGLGVRLRTGPSTNYGILGLYPVGTQATILRSGSGWHYVRIGRHTGYMMSEFLSTGTGTTPPSAVGGYTAYVTSENGLGVRLRKGAGTGYAVLGLYSVGTQVTVLEHGAKWDYIRVGSRTGYMMNKFLTTSVNTSKLTGVTLNTYAPTPGTTLQANITPVGATVAFEWLDAYGMKLGTGSTYLVGASDVGRQIRVRVTGTGSYTGTAVSAFATVTVSGAQAPTPLTGVTIDNNSPVVGQTLTATVSPAGATVEYIWYRDDGANLGNSQTYTVKESDAGHALYCAAYAKGNYTGAIASYYTGKVQSNAASTTLTGSVSLPASAKVGDTLTPTVSVNTIAYTYNWLVDGQSVSTNATLTIGTDMAGKTISVMVTAATGSGLTGSITSGGCTIAAADPVKPDEPDPEPLTGTVSLASSVQVGQTLTPSINVNQTDYTLAWTVDGQTVGTGSTLTITESMAGKTVYLTVQGKNGSVTSNGCSVYQDTATTTDMN